MHSHHLDTTLDTRPDTRLDRPGTYHSSYSQGALLGALLDRLQQPGVIVPLALILFAIFYQSLHSSSSSPLSRPRHPGELLWDFIVSVTPTSLLYGLDNWLHPPAFPVPASMVPTRTRSHADKSEILQRILGMDGPGSIITSVANAGRRSLSTLSSSTLIRHDTDQPPGLGNYDNSCFQNSILQGLSSLGPFPSYLARALEQGGSEGDGDATSVGSLQRLLLQLTDASYNGKTLWTPKKLKSLDTWQQQDAQEYFSKILDEVDKEVTKTAKTQHQPSGFEMVGVRDDAEDSQHSDDSGYQSLTVYCKAGLNARALRNPLEGLVAQRVACVQCGHSDGLSMIPFNCLTLNLGTEQTEHDLFERLDSYTDLETIEGVECAKCTLLKLQRLLKILISRSKDVEADEAEMQGTISRLEAVELALEEDDFQEETLRDKCKAQKWVSSIKTKQVAVARPPQSLAVHMNRSVFDESTGHMFKNLAAVRFPRTLDLGPWCLGSAGGPAIPVDKDANDSTVAPEDEEQWVTDPRSSMVSGDLNPSKIGGPIYELRAVITHQGRHENGHYVCYRKHPCRPPKHDGTPIAESGSPSNRDDRGSQDGEGTLLDVDDDEDITKAKWWRLSDETVREVPEETVLAQGGVFMLFYDCVDPNSVLIPTTLCQTEDNSDITSLAGQNAVNVAGIDDTPRTDPLEGNGQSQDATSDGQNLSLEDSIADLIHDTPDAEINSVKGQEIKHASLILIPPLADGERVDPIIPLHRPNR
ncbi:ubiquitin-specific protease ubp1 [Parahypoxylon ruwenzoriense]